jgi:hypothetical protein
MGTFQTKQSHIECIQQGLLHRNNDIREVLSKPILIRRLVSQCLACQHAAICTPFLIDQITTQSKLASINLIEPAIYKLVPRGDEYVVNRLLAVVDQDNRYVTTALVRLANKGDQRVIDKLVNICKKSDTYNYDAIQALSIIAADTNDAAAIKMLVPTLSTAHNGGSGCAANALISICSPGNTYVLNEVCKLPLDNNVSGVHFCSVLAHIANKGDEKVFNLLLEHLDKVTCAANKVIQLYNGNKQQLKDLFLEMTESADSSDKRAAAITMLAELCNRGDTVIQHLRKLTEKPFVGNFAIRALVKLSTAHDECLIANLCNISKDMRLMNAQRTCAIEALGSLLGNNKKISIFLSYTGPFFEDISFVLAGERTLNLHDSLNIKLSRSNVGINYTVCKVLIDCLLGEKEASSALDSLIKIASVGDPIIIRDILSKYEQSADNEMVMLALEKLSEPGNIQIRNFCCNALAKDGISVRQVCAHLRILYRVVTHNDDQVFSLAKNVLDKNITSIVREQNHYRGFELYYGFLIDVLNVMAISNSNPTEVRSIIVMLIEKGVMAFDRLSCYTLSIGNLDISKMYQPSDLIAELNTSKNEKVRDYLVDSLLYLLKRSDGNLMFDEKQVKKLLKINTFETMFLAVIGRPETTQQRNNHVINTCKCVD